MVNCDHYLCRSSATEDGDTEYDEVDQMRNMTKGTITVVLLVFAVVVDAEPLSESMMLENALARSPENTTSVYDEAGPVHLAIDLNGDGLGDIVLLTVLAEPGVPESAAELSDERRIHETGNRIPLFFLEIYLQHDDAVHLMEIGRYEVWVALEKLPVSEQANPRICVSVTCRSEDGVHRDLILMDETGRTTRLQAATTTSERSQLSDLDDDGDLDLVVLRRLPEASRGYETFVEWYDLGAPQVGRSGSFPLVRELNGFLDGLANAVRLRLWRAVVSYVADAPQTTDTLPYVFAELNDEETDPGPGFDLQTTDTPINAVVVTQFSENPFPEPILGQSTQARIRVESDGRTRYFSVVVRLLDNPFGPRRFAFLTDSSGGQ
jgi:hypothetical protein